MATHVFCPLLNRIMLGSRGSASKRLQWYAGLGFPGQGHLVALVNHELGSRNPPASQMKTKWAEHGGPWNARPAHCRRFHKNMRSKEGRGQRDPLAPSLPSEGRAKARFQMRSTARTTAAIQGCPAGLGSTTATIRGHAPTKLHNCKVHQEIQLTSPDHSTGSGV